MSAELKLRQIASIIADEPGYVVKAYERPELSEDEAVCDNRTINKDGSMWLTSKGENGPEGTKVRVMYGYISPVKNPELFAQLKRIMGPNFEAWDAGRDPWALYKADPRAMIFSGEANAINISWLLSTASRYEP